MENCASASPLFKKLMSILIKDNLNEKTQAKIEKFLDEQAKELMALNLSSENIVVAAVQY
jgi:hypothetical protein